jgi:hypothetical protein
MGAQLNPFAGIFCFVMSAITPPLVKHSAAFANVLSKVVPKSIRFSSSVVSRTLGKIVLPSNLKIFKGARMTGVLLAAFVGSCVAILLTGGLLHVLAVFVGAAITAAALFIVRDEILEVARHVNYSNIGVATNDKGVIVHLVSGIIFGALVAVLVIVSSWIYMWQFSVITALAYVVYVVVLMVWSFRRLYVAGYEHPQKVYHVPMVSADPPEPEADIPKPVYGTVRAVSGDIRL